MQAVVRIQGHQYLVKKGKQIRVARLAKLEKGQAAQFNEVLLTFDDKAFELGAPWLDKVSVVAKVLRQGRERKVIAFKYGPKDRTRKKRGFKPQYTELEITAINS